jgi:hypothetical protein
MPNQSTPHEDGRPRDPNPAEQSSSPAPLPSDPTAAPTGPAPFSADPTAAAPLPPPPGDAPAGLLSGDAPAGLLSGDAPAGLLSGDAPAGPPPGNVPAGPPPIVPPFNPWQAPGGQVPGGPFPTAYSGPVPPGAVPPGGYPPPLGGYPPPPGSYPPPPGAAWPQPPQARTFTAGLIAAIAVFAVVLLGCVGAVGAVIVRSNTASVGADPALGPGFPLPPSTDPGLPGTDDDSTAQGPQASTDAVKDINDLDDVCDDNVFFPKAPKYTGKAPHPIAIMIKDRKDMDTRISDTVYDVGYSSSKSRTDAWDVYTHPAKAQLTACVDLVGSGSKLKTCKFDDPKPDSLPLKTGTYQLTLFETATHKQLFAKKITGDDRTCPTVVLLGADHTLYTGITDKAYVSALKKFVEK